MDKIYTIIDKFTGQEYRAQFEGYNIAENEIAIEELRTELMENPYFDFKTRKFYGTLKVKEPTKEELISQKEDELISIYNEIQKLKNDSKN